MECRHGGKKKGCERNTERTLLLWNGRLAEITISAVRTEQWVVLFWKRERCIGKGCFFVVHITGLIRTRKVENICSALRAVGGRPCTSCALEPHKHTCKKTAYACSHLHNPHGAHFLLGMGAWPSAPLIESGSIPSLPSPQISETQVEARGLSTSTLE